MKGATLSILVHGESGIGKSRFGDTAPAPRLILDLEGRSRYLPSGPKVYWDPLTQSPPVNDGTWQTCIVMVASFTVLNQVYQWLRSGQHPFKSVVIDSIMEAQKRCIDNVAGTAQMQTQDWGTILRELEKVVRDYRDLILLPTNPIHVVCLVTGSVHADGLWRPLLQGALKDTLPYYIDVVGYMFPNPVVGADGITASVRSMLVNKIPGFVAKDGTDRFVTYYPSGIIPNPSLEQMYGLLEAAPVPVLPTAQEAIAQ